MKENAVKTFVSEWHDATIREAGNACAGDYGHGGLHFHS